MGVPKKRRSKSRIKSRQAQQQTSSPSLSHCPQCKALKLSHFACPECGYYKGRVVVKTAKG